MSGLRLTLLGTFEARWGTSVISIPSKKVQALVAFLALHRGRTFSREQLATMLWSRSDAEHARASLRQSLLALRRLIPSNNTDLLRIDGDLIGLLQVEECDAELFRNLISEGELEEALSLYRGEFLEGLNIPEPEIEHWVSSERRRLSELALQAMFSLIESYRRSGKYERAIDLSLRSLSIDPLQEAVHRALMHVYAETDRAENAIEQFKRCQMLLRKELGVEPDHETRALYTQIKDRRLRKQSAKAKSPSNQADARRPVLACMSVVAAFCFVPLAHHAVSEPLAVSLDTEEVVELSDEVFRLPMGPKIAVLEFSDLNAGPDEYLFAKGLTHDVIDALTQFREYFVFAAQTMSNYRVASADVREVARDLGADYVVRGSVRRDAKRIRVIASVIDGASGAQLWSETYDRDLTAGSLIEIQDELAGRVAATIGTTGGVVARAGLISTQQTPPSNMDTLDCIYLAYDYWEKGTAESHQRAQDCLMKAVKTDAGYPMAWVQLAGLYQDEVILGYGTRADGPPALDLALDAAKRSVALDPHYNRAHEAVATTYFIRHDLDRFHRSARKALNLNPNDADTLAVLGMFMAFSGDWQVGVSLVDKASQLNPYHPPWYFYTIGKNHVRKGEYREALDVFKEMDMSDQWIFQLVMTYTNALGGNIDAARAARQRLEQLNPGIVIDDAVELYRQLNFEDSYISLVIDGLERAGVSDGETVTADQ